MPKYGDAGTVTGKVFVGKEVNALVTALPAPVVAYADLAMKAKPINIRELSGKQLGSVVIAAHTDGKYYVAVATGSLDVSPWKVTELATVITPAA